MLLVVRVASEAHSASKGSDTDEFVRLTTGDGLLLAAVGGEESCRAVWKGLRGGMAGREVCAVDGTVGWLTGKRGASGGDPSEWDRP